MTKNEERYIVRGQLTDGRPGYYGNGAWHADRDRAKVYTYLSRAEEIASAYGAEVIAVENAIKPGYVWVDKYGPIRIIALADGYAMCRRPGALPVVISVKEIPQ